MKYYSPHPQNHRYSSHVIVLLSEPCDKLLAKEEGCKGLNGANVGGIRSLT